MKQIISFLSFIFNKKTFSTKPPSQVGDYRLVKALNSSIGVHRYATGIYSKNRQKVFIKTWSGSWKNYDYYSLLNESSNAKILQKYSSVLKPSHINLVRVRETIHEPGQLSLVYDYVPGKNLSSYSVKYQTMVLTQAIESMSKISQLLTSEDRLLLPKRNLLWHVAIFIPKLTKTKLSISTKFCLLISFTKTLIHLSSSSNRSEILAHGDLLPENIIISGRNAVVVDFGHTSLTLPGYDIAYIATQPNYSKLIRRLLPHGLILSQLYLSKVLAAVSAVSAETCTLQDYFINYLCG